MEPDRRLYRCNTQIKEEEPMNIMEFRKQMKELNSILNRIAQKYSDKQKYDGNLIIVYHNFYDKPVFSVFYKAVNGNDAIDHKNIILHYDHREMTKEDAEQILYDLEEELL
jgi:hypothetical protein